MPNIKSAEKRVRSTERKRLRNKPVRAVCKTNINKAERLIFAGDLKAAQAAVTVAITSLDKAAEKGIIHPNNAARRKSRLMKKFNQLQLQAPAPVETKPKAKAEVAPRAETKPKAAKPKAKAAKPKAKAEPKKAKKEAAPKKLDAEG